MAKGSHDHIRGPLFAEVLAKLTAETGGHERLAGRRIFQGIKDGDYEVSAETVNGDVFVPPDGCTWADAHYTRHSTASWWIGPKPVKANPLAGKVRPRETRRPVVAYAVRLLAREPAPPEEREKPDGHS
jgi:hypothetical protein